MDLSRDRLADVKGVRDRSYGILGFALPAFASARTAGWFMLVVTIAPLGDTLIVLRNGGTRAVAFGIHFATAVDMLINAALLFAVRREGPPGAGRRTTARRRRPDIAPPR